MIAARLHAYLPGGAALGFLPTPLRADATSVVNDVGSLEVDYSTLTAGGPHVERALASGLEIALEVHNGTAWTEPPGCRYVRIAAKGDVTDKMRQRSLTMPSYAWLLRRARILQGAVYPAGHAQAGKRGFEAPTVGSILVTLLAENAARNGVPLVPIFSATQDSAGAAWPTLDNQAFDWGTDYLSILQALTDGGYVDWRTQGRGLYCYRPGTGPTSADLSASVRLRLGIDLGSAPEDESLEEMVGRVGVRTDGGGTVVVTEPTAPTPWGVFEGFVQVGSVADQAAATAYGEAELENKSKIRGQYTRTLMLTDEKTPVPLVDYWPGAWVTAPAAGGVMQSVRLPQVTLSLGNEGITGSVILNDRIVEADLRRARNLANLLGGATSSPGGVPTIPSNPDANRVPSTPTGLDTVAALMFIGGAPRGTVTATWNAVTTATDTGTLTITGYELQWRIGAGAWQTISTPELTAQITDLTPGDAITARVRAIGARSTTPSAWSATDDVTVPGDVTPPAVPTVPVLASALRVVSITWDGALGAAIPADFAYVEVALGPALNPTTVVGTLTKAGTLQVAGQTIGATVRARLRAVDTTGNISAWSTASAPIVVAGVKGPDIEANAVKANNIDVGALDGKLITGATVRTAASGARVELSGTSMKSIAADGGTLAELDHLGLTVYQGGNLDVKYPSGRPAVDFASFNAQQWWGLLIYADTATNPDIFRAYYSVGGSGKHVYIGHELSPVNDFTLHAVDALVYANNGGGLYLENRGTGNSFLRADGGGSAVVQARNGSTVRSEFSARQTGETIMRGYGAGAVFVRNEGTGDAFVQAVGGGNAYLTSDSGQTWIGSTTSTTVRNTGASGLIELQVTNAAATLFRSRIQAGTGQAVLIAYDGTGVQTGRLDVNADGIRLAGYTTSGAAANVRMGDTSPNTGRLYQVTSSLRYKQDVEPLDLGGLTPDEVTAALTGYTWRDRAEVAEDPDTTMRYPGLIAEYVHDAGLGVFVEYDEDGLPKALSYDRMVTALAQVLKATRTELAWAVAQIRAQTGQAAPAVALKATAVPANTKTPASRTSASRKAARPVIDRPAPLRVATPTTPTNEEPTSD